MMPVSSLDRYVFRQGLTSFLVATVIVTAIVWVTQTLQRADIIVEHGRGLAVLARISLLILPSLLAVVIPFALFIAALYSIQRLHSDSEIAVMFASGVSRLRIGAPLILIAVAGALATLLINISVMPATYRILKREIYEIRTDFASALLRAGEFTPFDPGFTIYIEEVRTARSQSGGVFVGLLVNDYRDPNETITYMAQRGVLRRTENGPVLALANGNIQRLSPQSGVVEIIPFDETVINAAEFTNEPHDRHLELTERYLGELFHPDLSHDWDRANERRLEAEGHNRLASPLYAVAYAVIALYALMGGPYERRGHAKRIAAACAVAGALRILGFVAQTTAGKIDANWLQYAVPLAAIILFGALLSDLLPWVARGPRLQKPAGGH